MDNLQANAIYNKLHDIDSYTGEIEMYIRQANLTLNSAIEYFEVDRLVKYDIHEAKAFYDKKEDLMLMLNLVVDLLNSAQDSFSNLEVNSTQASDIYKLICNEEDAISNDKQTKIDTIASYIKCLSDSKLDFLLNLIPQI